MNIISKTSRLLGLIFIILFYCQCSTSNQGNDPVYTLTVTSDNGTISIDPLQESYTRGSSVTLMATSHAGYDFYSWSGDEESKENPFVIIMDSNKTIHASFVTYNSLTYYVDYDIGDDQNDGLTSGAPWKHAPGDSQASSYPASVQLEPGNRIYFRGGITYRGQISIPDDGSFNHHIIYQGNAWPETEKAIIDGGDLISNWTPCNSAEECGGNVNYANMYYTYLPGTIDPLSINLHELDESTGDDNFLWPAQDPNPSDSYFYDNQNDFIVLPQSNLTRTSVTDANYFTQSDPQYWNDSYILVWVNPNRVSTRMITGYNPALHRVTFDELSENALYPNGRDQSYAVFNTVHAIDYAGEYYITTTPDSQNRLKLILWPESTENLDSRITYSVRNFGFNIGSHSNITIEGFSIRKHSGSDLRDGVGIGTQSGAYLSNYNLTIKNNYITHNRKGGDSNGYGGIYLGNSHSTVVEDNVIEQNPRHAGIYLGEGSNISVLNNTIRRSGSTSLRLYSITKGQIIGNTITDSHGSHANGLTIYIGSSNILVANNHIYDCGSPVTIQDSGNLYFINNIVDASDGDSNINEWGDTSRGPWERGTIAFINNTIIRNNREASLNIGSVPGLNDYIVINNIIDGGASESFIFRSHNIYTGLLWNQSPFYGWSFAEGESLIEDLDSIFINPANNDYHLEASSPARGTGRDISPYIPVEFFPDFNFYADFEGDARLSWDIGAYAY